jgi:hypothetical protein
MLSRPGQLQTLKINAPRPESVIWLATYVGRRSLDHLAPPYDHAELPSNAAATLMCAYMCGRIGKSGALRH